ncbi:GPW/gp25 family protein [Pedobacter sp. ASV28]|uniref:GPW/gp25 family protein n=1 Tax=Pedobacter sp. ASV28 TaxID=2795123 RepID=UPI0018EDE021|nr:GPW/gp25 family protein [Pedobacter sp. ASV28]
MEKIQDKPYLGRGWAFPPHFTLSDGDMSNDDYYGAVLVETEVDIVQSLKILLSTMPGERIFRFDYGCNTEHWVFLEMNTSQTTLIIDSIEQAIVMGEPRILLEKIEIKNIDRLEGRLEIQLYYHIKETNSRSNMVYPFYFKEGTDLKIVSAR